MESVEQLLREGVFRNKERARADLEHLSERLSAERFQLLGSLLRHAPSADTALNYLQRYVTPAGQPLELLFSSPSRLQAAVALFSHSHFLADTLLRYPAVLEWALDAQRLYRVLSTGEMRTHLGSTLISDDDEEVARTFVRFKRMHVLRIALRDLLGLATLAEVTLELSNLTDAILQGAHDHAYQKLVARFGRPLSAADTGPIECQFVVLALGKLGGQELNYSSDIDLMFLYTDEGETSGTIRITNREFSVQLAHSLTHLLSHVTPEGWAYRVDLRLRPEGSMGDIVMSLRSAAEYYDSRARDWELQMLIKARAAAGSVRLGQMFLDLIDPLIYQTTTDFSTIERVAETRDRIQENLRRRRRDGLDVKLERGGIRDIEFLVQCMQRLYGGRDTWVRHGGTLFALHRLRDKGYLSMSDYARLNSAYLFLRSLEHRLQLEDNRQTHSLPSNPDDLERLRCKMQAAQRFWAGPDGLVRQVRRHLDQVTEIYDRVVHAQRTLGAPTAAPTVGPVKPNTPAAAAESATDHSWRSQLRFIEREAPQLAALVESLPIRWGRRHFRHFLNDVVSNQALLGDFERSPELLRCVADLMEHSPHMAEHFIRHPADIERLRGVACNAEGPPRAAAAPDSPSTQHTATAAARTSQHPHLAELLAGEGRGEEKSNWLRRFYRQRMLQILAESVYRRHPIFATLEKTTRLAEDVIVSAYEIAVEQVFPEGRPDSPLQVIALGRLGMREFDLASDADLIFVIPDSQVSNRSRWVHVVERLIEITSSYTREGRIFTVDARLRPMGRDGELVQSESHCQTYFAERAEAWEALTFMKARTVAGDTVRGAEFLARLQDLGWRRYGKSQNLSQLLISMRQRLEHEQGAASPIKAGAGGYYDIDFALMYLRLRDAGIFFESLNTPERINVIQTTGGLDAPRADALRDTAVFFRSLDHAIRVMTGQSAGKIPTAPAQQEIVKELLGRWSRLRPAGESLPAFFEQVRRTSRQLFSEILG